MLEVYIISGKPPTWTGWEPIRTLKTSTAVETLNYILDQEIHHFVCHFICSNLMTDLLGDSGLNCVFLVGTLNCV